MLAARRQPGEQDAQGERGKSAGKAQNDEPQTDHHGAGRQQGAFAEALREQGGRYLEAGQQSRESRLQYADLGERQAELLRPKRQ